MGDQHNTVKTGSKQSLMLGFSYLFASSWDVNSTHELAAILQTCGPLKVGTGVGGGVGAAGKPQISVYGCGSEDG